MQIKKFQRLFFFIFMFSLNFEMLDLSGKGFLSLGKLAGLLYLLVIFPSFKSMLSFRNIRTEFFALFYFFIFLTVVSLIYINRSSSSFFEVSIFQNIILFLIITNHERYDKGLIEKGFFYFALGSFLLGVLAFFGVGVKINEEMRMSIFGDNQNAIGYRMVFSSIILIVSFLFRNFNNWTKIVIIGMFPFLIITMISSGSRGAFITFVLCVALLILMYRTRFYIQKIMILILTSLVGGYFITYVMSTESLGSRLNKANESGDLSERDIIWREVMDIIQDHPVFGVGLTGYAEKINVIVDGIVKSPHNVFLEITVYTGVIGLVIFLFFLIKLLIISYKYYKISGEMLSFLLLLIVIFVMIGNQILVTKIVYIIFAFALSRKFYLNDDFKM